MSEKKSHKQSSGLRKARRIKTSVRRLNMKVKRWERYAASAGSDAKRKRWDTSGLLKHIELLKKI